jgi:hypothetical protein
MSESRRQTNESHKEERYKSLKRLSPLHSQWKKLDHRRCNSYYWLYYFSCFPPCKMGVLNEKRCKMKRWKTIGKYIYIWVWLVYARCRSPIKEMFAPDECNEDVKMMFPSRWMCKKGNVREPLRMMKIKWKKKDKF